MDTSPTPQPVGVKTDIQLQNEALIADAKKTEEQEKRNADLEKEREKKTSALASVLKDPTPLPRQPGILERKEVNVVVIPGQRPEVTFKGEWNGKFIMTVANAIARAYRHRKQVVLKPVKKG